MSRFEFKNTLGRYYARLLARGHDPHWARGEVSRLRYRYVLAARRSGATLAEIGRRIGLSRERTRQIYCKAERITQYNSTLCGEPLLTMRKDFAYSESVEHTPMEHTMIAYLHKTSTGYKLTIVARPCNGEEYQNGERVFVANKRAARAVCKARNIKPYNF